MVVPGKCNHCLHRTGLHRKWEFPFPNFLMGIPWEWNGHGVVRKQEQTWDWKLLQVNGKEWKPKQNRTILQENYCFSCLGCWYVYTVYEHKKKQLDVSFVKVTSHILYVSVINTFKIISMKISRSEIDKFGLIFHLLVQKISVMYWVYTTSRNTKKA